MLSIRAAEQIRLPGAPEQEPEMREGAGEKKGGGTLIWLEREDGSLYKIQLNFYLIFKWSVFFLKGTGGQRGREASVV